MPGPSMAIGTEPLRRRRRWPTPMSAALVAVALGFAGFYVGVREEKSQVATTGSGSTRSPGPGAARASNGISVGTVTRVDGDTIYVKENSGATVAVNLRSATTISKSVGVKRSSVRPGDSVTITGTAGAGGAINSASISDTGDNATTTTSTSLR
jgi:hypothetical protein